MPTHDKIAIITGASRGIGKAITLSLADKGYTVIATMRKPHDIQEFKGNFDGKIIVKALDVTNQESINNLIQEVTQTEGRIDLLVNNAGYGLFGIVEFVSMEDVQRQFDVNVYGVIRMTQAVLPIMRAQKSGRIINVSSVSGFVSNPCLGIYSGTKHAVEAISASVAATVFPWNIKVSLIEPGPVATEFAVNMEENPLEDDNGPYESFVNNYRQAITQRLSEGQAPEEIGELVAHVAEEENPNFRYQTSARLQDLASKFITDITGNTMIKEMQTSLREHLSKEASHPK